MKIAKVIEGLPEYTPAFLDIAGVRAEEVIKLTAQDEDGLTLSDLRQLGYLIYVQQEIGHTRIEHDYVNFLNALHISLGALVRVTEAIDRLDKSATRKVGHAVLQLAPEALEYSTSLKYQRSAQKLSSTSTIGVKNVSTRGKDEATQYVEAHATSYTTLMPFMQRRQKHLRPKPKTAQEQNSPSV